MKKIKVGGVPEHFNLPWHLCMEEKNFAHEDIDVQWRDFPDGTGAMNKALRNEEIDVAVILTEGIVKDITEGNPSKIVQVYVGSPLLWGIHVAARSGFRKLEELENSNAAISRIGSGSQLMAYVNAKNEGWDLDKLGFEIVGDIDGAVDALTQGRAQYFMWEHFTTKPLVDKDIFRRVADCPTPWPCFVIAVREKFLEKNKHEIGKMLKVLNSKTETFKDIPNIVEDLASRYGQKQEDIAKWLEMTSWSREQLSEEDLNRVQKTLSDLKLIKQPATANDILFIR